MEDGERGTLIWKTIYCEQREFSTKQKKKRYLNPADADTALKQLLDGVWKEQCDGESHGTVQRYRHEHPAGWDGVSQEDVQGERDEDNDLAGAEEGGHVETS